MSSLKSIFLPQDKSSDNPYQTQLAKHLVEVGVKVEGASSKAFFLPTAVNEWKTDILHIHWLHSFFIKSNMLKSLVSSVIFLCELVILRLIGVKIVWTVHNLKNHDNQHLKLERICTAIVAKTAHAIIAHCEAAKYELITTFNLRNHEKIFVVPHGNYIDCYKNNLTQTEARRILGIPDSNLVLLFLGLLRPYKGVLELLETFKQWHPDGVQLVIAGKIWNDSLELAELINQKVVGDDSIKFIPGFVANEKIQLYMNACDVVVFPYRDVLTSGAVLLAMSFGRACIAPRKGCIKEVLDDTGSFLYDPNIEESLFHAMNCAIQKKDKMLGMGEHNRQLAEQYSWDRIAEMTLKVYQWCLSS